MLVPESNNRFPTFFHASYFKVAMLMEEALPSPSRTKPCYMPGIPGTGSTQEPSMEALLQALKATMPRTAVKSLNLFMSLFLSLIHI